MKVFVVFLGGLLFSSLAFSSVNSVMLLGDDYRYNLVNAFPNKKFVAPKVSNSLIQDVKQAFSQESIILVFNMADGPTQKLRESILVARQSGHNSVQIYFHGKHLPKEMLDDKDFQQLMSLVIEEVNELLNLYDMQVTAVYHDWLDDSFEKFLSQKNTVERVLPEKAILMNQIYSHAYIFSKEEAASNDAIMDGTVIEFACQDVISSGTVRVQEPIQRGETYSNIILQLENPTLIPIYARCLGTLNNKLSMAFITISKNDI
ncbi:elongation factor Tu [Providencia sp. PROV152]|uniref:Elongation factor Tu n=1 Tax=Providencia stuartii TaxID=588 RepID=A0AAI9MWL9_PROST|nr:elongation factor Tu [Providencia sp. PROV152]ELR5035260.1 elongation factor Tu [Providencia stuartii]